MKHLVLLCDGMSDLPCHELGGQTPMSVANKPNMDGLSAFSEMGLAKTVPDGYPPGSDVANLSVLGYNPAEYYTGRSPLEAASMGIDMGPDDISLRCNLVALSPGQSGEFGDCVMQSYCANDIHTDEAAEIINFINSKLGNESLRFYPGVSYRHCVIWKNGTLDIGNLTPPHDITGERVGVHLNANANGRELIGLMEKSYGLLRDRGGSADSIWLWGEGKRAALPLFSEKFGLNAVMISAVDLLKGIGKLTGMEVVSVAGATGYIDTDFSGKANAAINALKNGADLVYIHVEAPDECGHRGEVANKVKSIELIDGLVLKPILQAFGDNRLNERLKILITPDHPTPLSLKTHTRDPVPYMIYDSAKLGASPAPARVFNEENAKNTGVYIENGFELMGRFIGNV